MVDWAARQSRWCSATAGEVAHSSGNGQLYRGVLPRMKLTIERFVTRGTVPGQLGVHRALVDQVARERFAAECNHQFDVRWPAQEGFVRIRRLRVRVRIKPLQLEASALAAAWVAAFSTQLFT